MKGMTRTFTQGFAVLFTSWQLYGMIAAGMLGMFLLQSAMNAGRLIAAQPGLTLSDPIVSILWGVFVFSEHVRGGWYVALAVIGGLVMAAAVVVLARSPLRSEPGSTLNPGQGRNGARSAEGGADAAQVVPVARRAARRVRDFAIDAAGGRARMRMVLTLAAVLGLSGADTGTVWPLQATWNGPSASGTPRSGRCCRWSAWSDRC